MSCLSHNLDILVVHLRERVRNGEVLGEDDSAQLADLLAQLADDARALEERDPRRQWGRPLFPPGSGIVELSEVRAARRSVAEIDHFLASPGPGGAA